MLQHASHAAKCAVRVGYVGYTLVKITQKPTPAGEQIQFAVFI